MESRGSAANEWRKHFCIRCPLFVVTGAGSGALPCGYLKFAAGARSMLYAVLIIAELLLFVSGEPINTAVAWSISRSTRAWWPSAALPSAARYVVASIVGALAAVRGWRRSDDCSWSLRRLAYMNAR